MNYEEFKDKLLEELRDFYGKDAQVSTIRMLGNNSQENEGIQIILRESKCKVVPSIDLKYFYQKYQSGEMDVYDCVEMIYREREQYECLVTIIQS
jgi:hypothetical protein